MPTRAIKSIFFTRFHHEKGSRVLHQIPEGSITPSRAPSALATPLFDFDSVTTYLIPTQQFCDRLLTFCTNHYRVIGYPVCIREGKYSRNEFIFNFAVVLEEAVADWVAYGEVVRKLGRLLRGLEEQGGFLSSEEERVWEDEGWSEGRGEGAGGGGRQGGLVASKVYALCEMVLEDLNNYAECMIPIDDSNTINLKLFPTHPPPPPIYPHHVPLLTISLDSLTSPVSSDLTLTRVLPFINGIHSVSHIAQLADTDLSLTRKAIQHLVYYGCLILLDIFSFGAVYAPTAEMGWFVTDQSVQEECARYVRVPHIQFGKGSMKMGSESERGGAERTSIITEASQRSDVSISSSSTTTTNTNTNPNIALNLTTPTTIFDALDHPSTGPKISSETLIMLYASLRQGLPLKSWVLENLPLLHGIDIRRFITFGIIKGILYRVHKYAIATSTFPASSNRSPAGGLPPSLPSSSSVHRDSDQSTIRGTHTPQHPHPSQSQSRHLSHKPSLASTANVFTAPTPHGRPDEVQGPRLESLIDERDIGAGLPLVKFLDGMHCFDEICTELGLGESVVEKKVKGAGEVQIVYR
ncbi:nitrogen permease regulator 2 [Melanomma pulvis-pyrius CBS 109.77]|uniref:Nitrogen permease regulator 2 n=1 Tax=Melanomma pulvis-pyrius CBS 109.77 TaxID=1314802 RepID=A0A6A6X0G1_9PLEO|nr:nitrogen permease regulator 2 [Melanomma pulvis-pyrius CBS 109.77]